MSSCECECALWAEGNEATYVANCLLIPPSHLHSAILAFPSSFLVLGMAGGVLATLIIGVSSASAIPFLARASANLPHLDRLRPTTPRTSFGATA